MHFALTGREDRGEPDPHMSCNLQYEALARELNGARLEIARLREALEMAVTQNESDMLMTGEELRRCHVALSAPLREDDR